jgi:hypothetical protein
MDLKGIGCRGLDWLHLAQHKDKRRSFVDTVMKLKAP